MRARISCRPASSCPRRREMYLSEGMAAASQGAGGRLSRVRCGDGAGGGGTMIGSGGGVGGGRGRCRGRHMAVEGGGIAGPGDEAGTAARARSPARRARRRSCAARPGGRFPEAVPSRTPPTTRQGALGKSSSHHGRSLSVISKKAAFLATLLFRAATWCTAARVKGQPVCALVKTKVASSSSSSQDGQLRNAGATSCRKHLRSCPIAASAAPSKYDRRWQPSASMS